MMKRIASLALLALILSSCGGGGVTILIIRFGGTVTGINCFSGGHDTVPVSFIISVNDFSAGSPVTLVDQSGNTWTGTMSSPSSFTVVNSAPNADPRTSISVSNFTHAGAHVDATILCGSFRCCPSLSGEVRA
jgi:hypothetical protein